MTEKSKTFLDTVWEVMKKNEKFLLEDAKNVIGDVVELANDGIDYALAFTGGDKPRKLYTERATYFYAYHVLTPSSYSIFTNLLIGSLPSCFRELRFMIEILAKCYLADLKYPNESFFKNKLQILGDEKKSDGKVKREHDFIREFGEKVNLESKTIKLWSKLSAELHARKYVEKVVESIVNKENVPGYALVIPVVYNKKDIDELNELRKYVCCFRKILNSAIPRE